ncbi:MAG: flagellar motor switch protein FliN [Acidobacteria bacterium]|nr:flagellar motor switch protein FliN [Acidobacteriota bacterium]
MAQPGNKEIAAWLARQFEEKLAQVIESMTGEPSKVNLNDAAAGEAAGEESFDWDQPVSLGDDVRISVSAPKDAWYKIGNGALLAAGIDDSDAESIRGTYQEILTQTLSAVAVAIGERLGCQVLPEGGQQQAANLAGWNTFLGTVELSTGELPGIVIGFSPGLIGSMTEPEPAALSVPASPAQAAASRPAAAAAAGGGRPVSALAPAGQGDGGTLDLLMDVELPVSISFGRASVQLKDVLKLTSGSIIELNRTLTEPVEMIVNNCVIARGEVVVVEGNYGIRIQEIVSRQERLRTLY